MSNVRLAGDHQNGNILFTRLSSVMSLKVSFCAVFSHEMSWIRPGTGLSQFGVLLPTLQLLKKWQSQTEENLVRQLL